MKSATETHLLQAALPFAEELSGENSVGIYAYITGNELDLATLPARASQFGPKDYLTSFHSLCAFSVANAHHLAGPVCTFSDEEFGFQQAIDQARRDLTNTLIHAALIVAADKHEAAALFVRSAQALESLEASRSVADAAEQLREAHGA